MNKSNESKLLIESHFENCENCKSELLAMNTILFTDNTAENLNEAEAVKHLSQEWKKGMFLSLLKGVFSTIITLAIILLILYIFFEVRYV